MPPLSQRVRRYTIRLSTIVGLGLLAASCSEGKLSQCKELIDVANQVVIDVQTVAENASTTTSTTSPTGSASPTGSSNGPDSVAVISKVAESAKKAQINMEALQLNDEKLKEFQSQYAAMYSEINQTTRDMLAAAEARDREAGKEAYDAFKLATSREGALVTGVNDYCAAK
jgi:hypothetical protein